MGVVGNERPKLLVMVVWLDLKPLVTCTDGCVLGVARAVRGIRGASAGRGGRGGSRFRAG